MSHSLQNKQNKLTAGTNIDITDDSTINCTMKLTVTPYNIGAYAFAGYNQSINKGQTVTVSDGTTKAGSSLYFGTYYSIGGSLNTNPSTGTFTITSNANTGENKAGTWKLMNKMKAVNTSTSTTFTFPLVGFWQRIS